MAFSIFSRIVNLFLFTDTLKKILQLDKSLFNFNKELFQLLIKLPKCWLDCFSNKVLIHLIYWLKLNVTRYLFARIKTCLIVRCQSTWTFCYVYFLYCNAFFVQISSWKFIKIRIFLWWAVTWYFFVKLKLFFKLSILFG